MKKINIDSIMNERREKMREWLCVVMALTMLVPAVMLFGSQNTSAAATENDVYEDMAVDGNGNVYVVGHTGSYGDSMYTGQDIVVCKFDSSGSLTWRRTWGDQNIYAPNDDQGYGIAIDNNNVYVVGCTNGNTQGYNIIILKYDLSGNIVRNNAWPICPGGSSDDYGRDIAISGDYIYITGYSKSFSPGQNTYDIVLSKYNKDGTFQWSLNWDSGANPRGDNKGYSITVDTTYVYVTGYATDPNNPNLGHQIVTLKWNKTNHGFVNFKYDGGAGDDAGYGIASDGTNLYIATKCSDGVSYGMYWEELNQNFIVVNWGWYGQGDNTVDSGKAIYYDSGTNSIYIAGQNGHNLLYYKYNFGSGQSSSATWSSPRNTDDCGNSVGIYTSGGTTYVFIGGYSYYYATATGCEAILLKYNCANQNWVNGWPIFYGQSLYDIFNSFVQVTGNYYVAGTTESYGSGASGCNGPCGDITKDVFVASFDGSWNCRWWEAWNHGGVDCANSIATDGTYLYVAGYTADNNNNYKDSLLIKYDLTGDIKWARTWDYGGDEVANAVAVETGTSGHIYITGNTTANSQMGLETFVLKYDKDGTIHQNVPGEYWPVVSLNYASDDSGNAIAIGTTNIYIAGYWKSVNNGLDVMTACIGTDGSVIGTYTWNNPNENGDDCANSLLIANNHFYIGGYTYNNGFGLDPLVQQRDNYCGAPDWSYSSFNCFGDDLINSVAYLNGYIYAGGYYSPNNNDVLMLKIDTNNGQLSTQGHWGLAYTDGIKCVIISSSNCPETVGWSYDVRYNKDGSMDFLMLDWDTSLNHGTPQYMG